MDIRTAILGATTMPTKVVPIPELGITVVVRGMTGTQRDEFEASLVVQRGRKRDINTSNIRGKLVAMCTFDDAGNRVFTDADVEQLAKVRADVLGRIATEAQRLCGLTDEDVDELGKSSSQVASPGSPSPSPASSE